MKGLWFETFLFDNFFPLDMAHLNDVMHGNTNEQWTKCSPVTGNRSQPITLVLGTVFVSCVEEEQKERWRRRTMCRAVTYLMGCVRPHPVVTLHKGLQDAQHLPTHQTRDKLQEPTNPLYTCACNKVCHIQRIRGCHRCCTRSQCDRLGAWE